MNHKLRSCRSPILLLSIFLHLISESLAGEPSTPVNEKVKHESSSSSIVLKVLLTFIGLAAVAGFSVFLFKMWQKKKRAEQHARLLKLFEDDDELEVELGIRD